jgi:3-hydroxyacyl-[acyl-carrier-protein] dehydratase
MSNDARKFSVEEIMNFQQNRYPMLFIDAVTDCVPGEYAKGFKLFSYNEWFFHGYETKAPKVWNAIQIEAMSQMFLMTFLTKDEFRGAVAMSNRFDHVEFRKKIEPGDRLDLSATLNSFRRGIARGEVKGYVGGQLACSMECTIVIPEVIGAASQLMGRTEVVPIPQGDGYATPAREFQFGIEQIQECLLNKYPWLLIDRVSEIEPGKFVRAIKNFTFNEHYFPAHFPGAPSVPGFIQVECCMQAFLLSFLSLDGYRRRETADRSLSDVRVRRKIVPGETLEIFAQLESFRRGVAKGTVESFVLGEPAISFGVTAVVVDELEQFLSRR